MGRLIGKRGRVVQALRQVDACRGCRRRHQGLRRHHRIAGHAVLPVGRGGDRPVRLEVGRIGRAHGLRGEVSVTLTSDRPSGSRRVACSTPTTARCVVQRARARTSTAGSCASRASTTAPRPSSCSARRSTPRRCRPRTTSSGCTSSSARRCATPTAHALGTVDAVEANPASDLLVLDGDVLSRSRSWSSTSRAVASTRPTGSGRAVNPPATESRSERSRRTGRPSARKVTSVRIDVFTIFPEYLDGAARPVAARPGARARAGRRAVARPARAHRRPAPQRRRRAVRRRRRDGDAARAAVRAVEAAEPPRPLLLLSASGRRFDQAMARELAAADGLLAALRPLRGRRPAGRRPPLRRRGLGRRLRARRRRGRRARDHRGGDPPGARGPGQRGVGGRGVVRRRRCSSTRSTPGRPSSGAGRCPRCCARATTPGSPAGGGPRPAARTASRRPDLLRRRARGPTRRGGRLRRVLTAPARWR